MGSASFTPRRNNFCEAPVGWVSLELGPAKHLLNALALPPTDRIAGMAGCPTVNCRSPIGGVLRHMRCDIALAQIGDKLGDIVGLVGPQRDPMIAGSVRHHFERGLAFGRAGCLG